MEKSCTNCGKSTKLIQIPGKELVYICNECLTSLKCDECSNDPISDDPNNNICYFCLSSPSSFIYVQESPFRQICYSCSSQMTRTGEKMFINVRWGNMIRSEKDLPKLKMLKEKMKELKSGFNVITRQLDRAEDSLKTLKFTLIEELENYFRNCGGKLNSYRDCLKKYLKDILNETKADIFNGKYQNSLSKGIDLMRSEYRRNMLINKKLVSMNIKEDCFIESLYKLIDFSFYPIDDLIENNAMLLFHPKASSIYNIFPDIELYEEVQINQQEVPWKYSAAWCYLENGCYIYTGGEKNNKTSTEALMITIQKEIKTIAACYPKKNHCLVFHEGLTYSFGGNNDICERYISPLNEWENFASPPDSLGPCSAISYRGKIIITCFKRKELYIYDAELNKYQKRLVHSNMVSNCSKLLLGNAKNFESQGKVFILQRQKVFVSDVSMENWTELPVTLPANVEWHSMCTPIYLDYHFYFFLVDYRLFSFSLRDYSVKQIEVRSN